MKHSFTQTGKVARSQLLRAIDVKRKHLQRLCQILEASLPPQYQTKISVLSYSSGLLNLGCSDQLLSARLRFYLQQLQDDLKQFKDFAELQKIKLKVIELPHQKQSKAKSPQKVQAKPQASEQSAQLISDFAQSLGDDKSDKAFKQSLERLSRHLKS